MFFAPLFLVEATTLSLLMLSPMLRLSRAAFFSFALMLAVFAAWGLSGFGYPSAPVPFIGSFPPGIEDIRASCWLIWQRLHPRAPKIM